MHELSKIYWDRTLKPKPEFSFLEKVRKVEKISLILSLKSRLKEKILDVCRKGSLSDNNDLFLYFDNKTFASTKVEMFFKNLNECLVPINEWEKLPVFNDLMKYLLYPSILKNRDSVDSIFFKVGPTHEKPLLTFIAGEIFFEGKTYFLIENIWYKVRGDLECEFRNHVRNICK